MKTFCKNCGCHFPQDFDVTLQTPCNLWGDHGMANLPIEYKKKFWDWLFLMPADEILGYKMNLGIQFYAVPNDEKNLFEKMVPDWGNMSESERQEFERKYFKDMKV